MDNFIEHLQSISFKNTFPPKGLLGVNIPAEVGGVGGSFLEEQIVIEEGAYRWHNIALL